MRPVKLLSLLLLALPLTAAEVAVQPGDPAPDFELSDANGDPVRLSQFKGKNAVVIEFFRSGDW